VLRAMETGTALGLSSGFRRKVDENCALLGHYAASSGKFLPSVSGQLIGPMF